MEQELWGLIEETARARQIKPEEILGDSRNTPGSSARRAICVVMKDKYGLNSYGTQPMTWSEMARVFGRARSGLHVSVESWSKLEGSEDSSKEERLRERGHLPKNPQGSIDDMVEALSKRKPEQFAYWHSKRKP